MRTQPRRNRTSIVSILTEAPALPLFQYEAELQQWLAANPDTLEPGLWIVGYEFPLGENRIDLLGVDQNGALVVIEVKRANATREAVGQVLDYVSALELMEPAEIAESINQAAPRPELAPVVDFEREYGERYGGVLTDLMPVRALLACTSESAETGRILEFLQELEMDVRSVVFKGTLLESGERRYRRRTAARESDAGVDTAGQTQQVAENALGLREPCRSPYPRANTKGRLKLNELHQRAEEYPGVELFRSVHCAIIHAMPEAHEIALPERDWSRELTAAIAFDMAPTSKDERTTRPEYLRIRMFPESAPGEVLIVLFDRALWRAGDSLSLLDDLSDYRAYDGANIEGEALDRVWISANFWEADRPILEQVLRAIHREWESEREADRR